MLAARDYSKRYVRMLHAFEILETCNVAIDVDVEPDVLLRTLLERRSFQQAQRFAQAYELPLADVAIAQARHKMHAFLQSRLADSASARCVVLNQCEQLLADQDCDAERGGLFFLDLVRDNGTATATATSATTPFGVHERVDILRRGLDWLLRDAAVAARCRASALIARTERRMWSLRIQHEAAVIAAEDAAELRAAHDHDRDRDPVRNDDHEANPDADADADVSTESAVTVTVDSEAAPVGDTHEVGVRGWGTAEATTPLDELLEPQQHGDGALSAMEERALQRLLARLLDRGMLAKAVRLAMDFGLYHADLITVQIVFFLAQVR